MADEADLKALEDGERDLVQADFRGTDLSGRDLSHRDLTGAKFDKANLGRSNLSKSVLSQASFVRADLSGANLTGCVAQTGFVHTKLSDSILNNARFRSAIFHTCDLSRADLRGADFSRANLINDNVLNDAQSDEKTNFDGAQILRPMIRNPVFRYYRLERGKLIRKEFAEEQASAVPTSPRSDLVAAIGEAEVILRQIEELTLPSSAHGEVGHNQPPDEFALSAKDFEDGRRALTILGEEAEAPRPNLTRIRSAKRIAVDLANKAAAWAARKLEIASDEFAKEAGKNLASPGGLLALTLIFSGQWTRMVELLIKYFS